MPITGKIEKQTYDVVVVGCGSAALSAAVSAAEQGARVAVLERSTKAERGGNSKYTEAYFRVNSETEIAPDLESMLEASAGGHIDPELAKGFLKPWKDQHPQLRSLGYLDPEVISTFSQGVPPMIAWLKKYGVRIDALPTDFITVSTPRLMPIGGGQAIIDGLAGWAEQHSVTFHYQTTAFELLQDSSGLVTGVRAKSADGSLVDFEGKATILACGGFGGNQEMLTRYVGPHAHLLRTVARGGLYNKGEGIRMALDIGAAPAGQYGAFHAETIDPRASKPNATVMIFSYGIVVNQEGRRFMDEASGWIDKVYEPVARAISLQTGGIGYFITDAKLKDVPVYTRGLKTDQPPILADTLEELAKKLEIPIDALDETVRNFNKSLSFGKFDPLKLDGLATRGLTPPKSNWARPIDQPPYMSYPIICTVVLTFGGLKVNAKAQVVNTDGNVIPGLYAAGETAGMYYGPYVGATQVMRGIVFGRIAGCYGAHDAGH